MKTLEKDEIIQHLLKEKEINDKVIGGYEVKVEELREQIKRKDEIIKKKDKEIKILNQKIERLNQKIETLYFNFPIEIEKQLKKLSNIPIELSKNLSNELYKRLQETQETIYKEVLIERLRIEKEKLKDGFKTQFISILKKINFPELILILESKNITEIFEFIAESLINWIKIEEELITQTNKLRNYCNKFIESTWSKKVKTE